MRTGFIGAGKVGFTLGKYFSTHSIQVTGYYSRNTDSARAAASFTETEAYEDMGRLIEASDVLFLTVPDGSITSVYAEVRAHDIAGKLICHTSGALTAGDAFPGIEDTGAFGFSVHPLFAVSDRYHAYEELPDVFFAAEAAQQTKAAAQAFEELLAMLRGAGLSVQEIAGAGKARYHLAASVASNLVVGLMDWSISLLESCGFSEESARKALGPLAEGNLRHILEDGTAAALTGPLERGDTGTLEKHLAALNTEEDRTLYCLLSEKLLGPAERKHPDRDYGPMKRFLTEGSPEAGIHSERK